MPSQNLPSSRSRRSAARPRYTPGALFLLLSALSSCSSEDDLFQSDLSCEVGWRGEACDQCAPGYHAETGACVVDRSCAPDSCSGHGACDDTSGVALCTCDEGYAGATCGACDAGHHLDALSACVPDESCAAADPCGPNGTCNDTGGIVSCACDAGYTGDTCLDCAAGYHADGEACVLNQTCALDSCSGHGACDDTSGVALCTCDEGYAGATCGACDAGHHLDALSACVPDESCAAADPCGPNGTCNDTGGIVSCACDAGYTGDTCLDCAAGYHANGEACVLNQTCALDSCSEHGACDDTSGVVSCSCDAGYAGAACSACDAGFHLDALSACVPDESCAAVDPCGPNGTCDDAGGIVSCDCAPGYQGDTCLDCAAGYHAEGEACVLDQACEPDSCSERGACDDTSGIISCSCDAAYSGSSCGECAAGYDVCGDGCVADIIDQQADVFNQAGTAGHCYGSSFTVGQDGTLIGIELEGLATAGGTQLLYVYAGDAGSCPSPGVGAIRTQTITLNTRGWRRIALEQPITVTAGQTYTFQAYSASGGWQHLASLTNLYAGGRSLISPDHDISFRTVLDGCSP